MAPRLVIKCPPPLPSSVLPTSFSSSSANSKLQLSGKATVPSSSTNPKLQLSGKATMPTINALALEKRPKEKKGRAQKDRAKKNRAKRHRSQAVSSFHREPLPPVHRCPDQVEATLFNYPVIRTSTELLKVVLHSMMSSVFFFREFLPSGAFGVRDLPVCFSDENFCYQEHFMNGSFTPEKPLPDSVRPDQVEEERGNEKSSEDIAHWLETGRIPANEPLPRRLRKDQIMVMETGKDKVTDGIVRYLEDYIFQGALLKRRLLGLQIAVCRDKDSQLDVYETYTISIDCNGRLGPSDRKIPQEETTVKADFHDPKEDYLSSVQVKQGIMDMFRKLYVLTSHLSALPDDRHLVLHAFHPPFVRPIQGDWETELIKVLSFPKIPGWGRETFDCGFIDTGFYGARLQVTYLKPSIGKSLAGVALPEPELDAFRGYKRQADNLKFEHGRDWVWNHVSRTRGRRRATEMSRRLKRVLSGSPLSHSNPASESNPSGCRRRATG